MIDGFVLDLKTKEIIDCFYVAIEDEPLERLDSFAEALKQEIKDGELTITRESKGVKNLNIDGRCALRIDRGKVTHLDFRNVTEIGNSFLNISKTIQSVFLPNVKSVGNLSLLFCPVLTSISLPKLEKMGPDCIAELPLRKILEESAPSEDSYIQALRRGIVNGVPVDAPQRQPPVAKRRRDGR
ncbi:hypothetical protein FACS1894186_2040 [Alphaproteobacteria bacterium]|nr:hypothetical protein FACS1894186_2040 [Alphaproteobacteria bacterium]